MASSWYQVRPCYVFTLFLATLVYAGFVFVMVMMVQPLGKEIGLVEYNPMEVANELFLPIFSPQTIITIMWLVIFLLLFLCLAYAWTTTCRKINRYVALTRSDPNPMPLSIYLVLCLALGCVVAWYLLFSRKMFEYAIGGSALAAIFLWIAVWIAMKALASQEILLFKAGQARDVGLLRGVVHNGLGFFAMWATFEFFDVLGMVLLVFVPEVEARFVALVILCSRSGFLLLYYIVDLAAADRYSRYLVTPYMIALIVLATNTVFYWQFFETNTIISLISTVVTAFAFVAKLIMVIGRYKRPQN